MIAIHTKYLGPTNVRGSRIKAYTASGFSATVPYDHSLSGVDVHFQAVKALVANNKLEWNLEGMRCGDSADGCGYSFCFDSSKV